MQLNGDVAGPVACPVSDCQAIIASGQREGDPRDLIRAAGASVYDFNHQRMQCHLAPYYREIFPSPLIDLSSGFNDYIAIMRERSWYGGTLKTAQPAERRVGPLRFTMHEADADALKTLILWSRRQYQRSGEILPAIDIFSYEWTVKFLERIHATQSEYFADVLSTLRMGDRLVAAHMGMRSHNVLHYWFPAYDIDYAKFSPGRFSC